MEKFKNMIKILFFKNKNKINKQKNNYFLLMYVKNLKY